MSRSLLHGGPARSHQDARSSQDARSNFAVQPASKTGSFKLKKSAVKIVGTAGPAANAAHPQAPPATAASTSSMAASSLPTPGPSPAPSLAAQQAAARENEVPQVPQLGVKPTPSPSAASLPPLKTELPYRSINAKGSLDDMFTRLSGATPSVPSLPAKELCPINLDKSMFLFDDAAHTIEAANKVPSPVSIETRSQSRSALALPDIERLQGNVTIVQSLPQVETQRSLSVASWQGERQSKSEAEYLRKAAKYFSALPTRPGDVVYLIRTVALKLHTAYAPNKNNLQSGEEEKLRARYVFAVTTAVNKKIKLGLEPLTTDFVKKILCDCDGDFLQLCASLVKASYIALNDLKRVTDLCETVLDVLPKPDGGLPAKTSSKGFTVAVGYKPAESTPRFEEASIKPGTEKNTDVVDVGRAKGDPLEGMNTWPTQEKREHGAIYRACLLKGVDGVKSLNQLQALVWGGRLEFIRMPEPGSKHALVQFLTPEACQTYLDATENGIEVQGAEKKTIVFVEKHPGPSSINDVIQNCIEGDASRCVRATGADDDWSDSALFKLARGKQSIPRDVDRIKQGKTARGHHYIEFRFGNIYHALNFRRYLTEDNEWEHCSFTYSKDPCELACGVHYKDADEDGGGLFA